MENSPARFKIIEESDRSARDVAIAEMPMPA